MDPEEPPSDGSYFGDVESDLSKSPTDSDSLPVDSKSNITKENIYEPLGEYLQTQYEEIERYKPGGFHPIHIGDYLDVDKNFEVLHKLGFGTSSTIWLCFDNYSRYYRAVKIFAADTSNLRWHDNAEVEALADRARDQGLPHHVIMPIDKFWLDGPNGHHLCQVLPVLGPNLLDRIQGAGLDTPEYLKDLCYNLASTVNYLHQNGIVHGDIRPQKIMRVIASQWMWKVTRAELFEKYISKPETRKLKPLIRTFAHHGPRYLVARADLGALECAFRTDRVALTDFGQVCQSSALLNPAIVHRSGYSAPEIRHFDVTGGTWSDVWSLGACLYLLRTGREILPRMESTSTLLGWLGWVFGPRFWHFNRILDIRADIVKPDRMEFLDSNVGKVVRYAYIWIDDLKKTTSRYRRTDSKRTFRKAVRDHLDSAASDSDDGDSEDEFTLSPDWDPDWKAKISTRPRRNKAFIPGTGNGWDLLLQDREDRLGFPNLLHEFLSIEETWHEMPETMRSRGLLSSGIQRVRPRSRTSTSPSPKKDPEDTSRARSRSSSRPPSTSLRTPRRSARIKRRAPEGTSSCHSAKKQRAENEMAIVHPEVDDRDQVSCTETSDGMIEYVYRMQRSEVDVFADLLLSMLQPSPGRKCASVDKAEEWSTLSVVRYPRPEERTTVKKALKHAWFGSRNGKPEKTAVEVNTDEYEGFLI